MAISRANKEFNFVKFCEVNDYKFTLNKDDFVRDIDNLPIGITVEINNGAVISFMPAQGHYEELPMHHNKSTACDLFSGESFKAIDNDWYSSKTYTVTHFIQLAYEVSYEEAKRLLDEGVVLSHICPLMYLNNPKCGTMPVITCSNKLRTYTSARFYKEDELLLIITGGNK